ncbi:helix-turn-helix transcriptional regulator [Microbispora cellulosiformans]|uniref:Helix-turn-helix transcriptional regulator n=1 Tax=Microbispora cellulosiformans TaxID=2614688 RepID=A0A5J5K3A8_9ACTN|nr:AraC family transcriptional regulator [Microbispora cellulosiformans]KAA9377610.1 helix-turn-helix transcriptional regulator [Microbispora cellulosiformans]
MNDGREQAVRRAVRSIRENFGEPLTIDDLARAAMFSKFHFTRVFQQVTGVSPGRFLSAIRLQEAKRLLLSTTLSVTEISNRVGYTSVGTFSSRFKSSVGLCPSTYRQVGGVASRIPTEERRPGSHRVALRGEISSPQVPGQRTIFVGLFPDAIPQGRPVRCRVLHHPQPFVLEDVPQGSWHLLAQSVTGGREEYIDDLPPFVAAYGPITVRPGVSMAPVRLRLRPMRDLDPPVLLALLDARRTALQATAG